MDKSLANQTFLTIACQLFGKEISAIKTFPSNWHILNRIITAVVNSILVIPTVSLNVIAIVTVQKSCHLKNRLCYFAIVLQSVADTGVGCFTIPVTTFFLVSPFLSVDHCVSVHLMFHVGYLMVGISIITLSVITMERYIGVVHPYSYATLVTKRRILAYVIGGISLDVLVITVLSTRVKNIEIVFFATMVTLFFILNAFVYSRIYFIIQGLLRSKVQPSHESRSEKKKCLREMKHARSCFLVVLCFVLCMTPFLLSPIILQKHGRPTFQAYRGWSIVLATSNSMFNSIIFFWTKTLMRKEAMKIVKTIWT